MTNVFCFISMYKVFETTMFFWHETRESYVFGMELVREYISISIYTYIYIYIYIRGCTARGSPGPFGP